VIDTTMAWFYPTADIGQPGGGEQAVDEELPEEAELYDEDALGPIGAAPDAAPCGICQQPIDDEHKRSDCPNA